MVDLVEVKLEVMESLDYKTGRFEFFLPLVKNHQGFHQEKLKL